MSKPRDSNPTATAAYHLRFRVGDWVPDLSGEEKAHLRHLCFSVARALFIGIIDYAVTPRGLEVIVKVPPPANTKKLSHGQVLHLMSLLKADSQIRPLVRGLNHPVPHLRAAYVARIERHRATCCNLSVMGKVIAQGYARWWKVRNPGHPKVWRERFRSRLLPNTRPATIAASSAAILETLRAHGIKPDNYPWHAGACPPPEPPKSVRAVPELRTVPGKVRFNAGKRRPAGRKNSRGGAAEPSLKEKILALLPEGHTQDVIAAKVGCSRAYVSLVKIQAGIRDTRPGFGRGPEADARRAPVALNRKQAAMLRTALTTKLPADFSLPAGGFSQPWNRINAARLCRALFGMHVRPSNLDTLLVEWKISRPIRSWS